MSYQEPHVNVLLTCRFVNTMYLILKGTKSKAEDFQTEEMIASAKDGDLGPAAVPAAIAAVIAFAITAAAMPYMSGKAVEAAEALEIEMKDKTEFKKAPRKGGAEGPLQGTAVDQEEKAADPEAHDHSIIGFVQGQMEKDVYESLQTDSVVGGIHERVQRHDARTEELFKYVQIFTAIIDSFSHGANDVANAMGPYVAVYMTYKNGKVDAKTEPGDNIYWILAIGGLGIALGLATYGYKIMNAIGVKLTAITPSRGFCIELGAAFVIIFGTGQGWPLSTTHCQVGATVGVGLFEGAKGINGWILGKTVFGWVITLVVVGISAAILVGPSPEPDYNLFCSTGEGLDADDAR